MVLRCRHCDSRRTGQTNDLPLPALPQRSRLEGFVALFAENGAFVGSNNVQHQGRAAIRQFMSDVFASQSVNRHTKHLCGISLIDVKGESADAETDFVTYERYGDAPWQIHTIGRYHDQLTLEDGEWRFLKRQLVTVGASTRAHM